jgi:glutaredoxin
MARRNRVYLLAILSSLLLYLVGVFTGAFILEYTEDKTSMEFANLHEEIQGYGQDLESIELEQLYLASGQGELGCKFIVASLNRVQSDLGYFWDKLPEKLEVFERYNPPDESYEALKRDYMAVSLKAWLLSLSVREKCGRDITPVLYFYSSDCDGCIEQGSVLDQARQEEGILVYTIDLNLDSDAVSMVREAYGIERAPALIIGEKAYQGLVSYGELVRLIEKGGAS